MNIKTIFNNSQTTTNSLGNITLFQGNTLRVDETNNHWLINGEDTGKTTQDIAAKSIEITKLYASNPGSASTWNENLGLLNSRINAIKKELTYWDLYKITKQINQPGDLNPTFASLTPGQSLVVNTDYTFTNNGQNFSRGDVVVKMLDNQAALIRALSGGTYKPQSELEDGYLTFTYETAPQDGDSVTIEMPEWDISSSFIYGIYNNYNNEPIEITPVEYNGTVIKPYIKFFTSEKEEIYLDYTATTSGDNTIITPTNCILLHSYQVK